MINRDLYQFVAHAFNQRRNKAMHAMEWDKGFPALAPHRLKRTAGIADAVPGEPAPDRIGNPALRALEPAILAFGSKAAHQVGASSAAYFAGLMRADLGSYLQAFILSGLICMSAAVMVMFIGVDWGKRKPAVATA